MLILSIMLWKGRIVAGLMKRVLKRLGNALDGNAGRCQSLTKYTLILSAGGRLILLPESHIVDMGCFYCCY